MRAALRGSYVEYVLFIGVTERYPLWFQAELYDSVYMDENRYTFYVPMHERTPDYYEKTLVEDYSVFLKKPNGDIHVTDYDIFNDLYVSFKSDTFTNSGLAAFEQDCIEYVECRPGVISSGYPDWFYEYFTEVLNFPKDEETIYLYDTDKHCLTATRGSLIATAGGEASVKTHCVFLRNKYGEIRGMEYKDFLKYYDPDPIIGKY
jgi:hypothetical protein